MDEEKVNKEPEETAPSQEDGDKPKSTEPIESANKAAKRLEDANAKKEALLDREEALLVQARLSGRALAGEQPAPPETEHEKWKREAKVRYAGTGMDPTEE